jgi:hypothetical protein
MTPSLRWLLSTLAIALPACSDTAVVVQLSSDRPAKGPGSLDGFCLGLDADGEDRFAQLYRTSAAPLPQSLTVFPGSHARGLARAIGLFDGQPQVEVEVPFSFSSGKVDRASLGLDRCPHVLGSGSFTAANAPAAGPSALAALVVGPSGNSAIVFDGAGANRFAATAAGLATNPAFVIPAAAPAKSSAVVSADLDGDCLADLIVTGDGGALLYRNDAAGNFTVADGAIPSGPRALAAATGDLDGDGLVDLVLCGGPSLRVLTGDGHARFTELASAIVEPGNDRVSDATACVLADFDGDGHLDLAVGQGSAAPLPNRLYTNDPAGTGHLTYTPGALPALPEQTTALAAADFDLDGNMDLAAAHLGAPVRLYLNRGAATLEDRSFGNLPDAVAADVPSLLAADLDGDCAPDLVVPRAGAAPLFWRNDGSAGFVAGPPLPAKAANFVLARDVDGDGLPDLLLAGGLQGLALLLQSK